MAYLALIHRAQGLICYAYHDLFKSAEKGKPAPPEVFERRWGEVSRIAKAVRAALPALLEGEEVAADLVSPLRYRVLRLPKATCVVVVNTDARDSAALALPVPVGTTARELDTGRTFAVQGGEIHGLLGPLAAAIYLVE
jgi:hypothetical protein